MSRARTDGASAILAGLVLVLGVGACGKKAPLRLPEDRPVVEAAAPRPLVREGRVTLEFQVPRHRLFPEREDPWVLARILRQAAGDPERTVEVGAILETAGFAFGSPLSWSDREQPAGAYVYRVEFRDGARRRRALSGPVSVAWDRIPEAPQGLAAAGGTRAVVLSWTAAGAVTDATRFAVYRREPPASTVAPITPEPVAESRHVDSRVEPDREYCYAVRAVLTVKNVLVEGPASEEACAAATSGPPTVAPPAGAAP